MQRGQLSLGHRLASAALRYSRVDGTRSWPPARRARLARPLSGEVVLAEVVGQGPAVRSLQLARLEAVLFLSREPVPSRKLAQMANLADGTMARSLVRQLRLQYDARGTAFQVEEVAGGFQLLTRRKFAPWLRRLEQAPSETRLSHPALETLAVVAYRQPVPRAEIEAIRGVQCGEILRQLMERDLVRISGRADELGRPFLYGTTRRFLQLFGLRHVDELPRAEQLRQEPIPAPPPVANPAADCHDSHSENQSDLATVSDEEVSPVTATKIINSTEELWETVGQSLAVAPIAPDVNGALYDDEDEELDDDEEYEDEDDEDYEYEDDEDEDDEDEEEEDEELEEDEEEEELEGDWEEVEDEDEEDEDEEEEDEEYEEEDEEEEEWADEE